MRHYIFPKFCLVLSLWANTFSVSAEIEKYTFDAGHTRIFFSVNHLGFSDFQGMFHKYDGGFTFDTENLANSKIKVTVDMTSADMHFEKMNKQLLSPKLLDVKNHPKAEFISTKITQKSEKQAQVEGSLTLRGITRPVTLDVQFNKAGENAFSKRFVRGFTATGVIDRTDFGIDYVAPMVSKEVQLTIQVEGNRALRPKDQGVKNR